MDSLTKENFWNDLYEKFPAEMEIFCKWIDEYKNKINWNDLFTRVNCIGDQPNHCEINPPKYHDLPIAMQIGIFIQFRAENVINKNINWPPSMADAVEVLITEYFTYPNFTNPSK